MSAGEQRAKDGVERWTAHFDAFQAGAEAGDGAEWLRTLRRDAFARFREQGFPTRRLEEWKYTNVDRIARAELSPAPADCPAPDAETVEALSVPVFACSLFVFVNGHFAPALSTPRAVSGDLHVESLANLRAADPACLEGVLGQQADTKSHAFAALNTGFLDDGAVIRLPRGQAAMQPIHLVFLSTEDPARASATHPRVVVDAQPESHAVIIQDHVSIGNSPRRPAPTTRSRPGTS